MRRVEVDMWWNQGMVERMLDSSEPQQWGGCSMGLREGGNGICFEDTEEQSTAEPPTPPCISSLSSGLVTSTYDRPISGATFSGLARTCDSLFAFGIRIVYSLSFWLLGMRKRKGLRVGCRRGSGTGAKKNWIRRYEYKFMRDATSCHSFSVSWQHPFPVCLRNWSRDKQCLWLA